MELHALPLGWIDEVVTVGPDAGTRTKVPVSGHLVKLDDGGLVLIDTGMHDGHVADPDLTWRGTEHVESIRTLLAPEDSIVARLASIGVRPEEVTAVVNTHLHFDHAGNNALFTGATFYAQREHYEFALNNPSFPHQYWDVPGLAYELLDGETVIEGDLTIVPTPGHAPGHQSVVVPLARTGVIVITGDAVNAAEDYDNEFWDYHRDPETARRSAYELRDLAGTLGAQLFYSHDAAQAKSIRWAPDGFYD